MCDGKSFRKNLSASVRIVGPLGLMAMASIAPAAIIGYDFESLPVSSNQASLATTNAGTTLVLTRNGGGATLGVTDISSFGAPVAFGNRSVDPFADTGSATAYLIGNLTSSFSSVSVQFGDFGADSDSVTLTGYSGPNGTGTAVATSTVNYGTTSFPASGIILNSATSMQSFTLSSVGTSGASTFYNSLFYDNFVFTTIPEPATASLVVFAAALAGRRSRKA